jgi:hypothetical protein
MPSVFSFLVLRLNSDMLKEAAVRQEGEKERLCGRLFRIERPALAKAV